MLRKFFILLTAFLPVLSYGQGVADYFASISDQCVDSIISKVDLLVDTIEDDDIKSKTAGLAFDYFRTSPLMGHDAVAVHVADKYFLSKQLKWPDDATYPFLYAYAEFNRSSLIGCDAPELLMESYEGVPVSLRNDLGQYKLLYFYDTQCSTCREYSEKIAEICHNYGGGRLSVFAFNTGSDREVWKSYINEKFFGMNGWKLDFHNVWDPEDSNDFRRKYGVLSTPTVVMLDSQNKIIGRSLDPDALRQLIGVENNNSRSYKKLFSKLFKALSPMDSSDIRMIASSFAEKAAADSTVWRDGFYELFNRLRDNPNAVYQDGAVFVAENYILAKPEFWSTEYVDAVKHALEMFRLNPLGSKASDLRLIDTSGKFRMMLKGRSKYTLLIFHIVDCPDCKREFTVLEREAANLKKKGVRVVCVYAGKDEAKWKNFASAFHKGWTYLSDVTRSSGMGEKYDITFVPKLYLLDRKGIVIAKEIDAETLAAIEL